MGRTGSTQGEKLLGRLGVDGKMISKWSLKDRVGDRGLDSSGQDEGPVAGSCEDGNEPSDSIKCSKFLDKLSACQLLNEAPATWAWLVM
jgi:hypothetical protein